MRTNALYLLLFFWSICVRAQTSIRFEDVSEKSGVNFEHTDGSSGKRFIVETVASGLGLIDFDDDGYIDIYFLNGSLLPGNEQIGRVSRNALYRNNGNWTFTEVSERSGLGLTNYFLGCAVADYDNDGDEDIFITGFPTHHLMRNEGGNFIDVTAKAGLSGASHGEGTVGAGCAFLDFDRDGLLDLYVGNYLKCDLRSDQPCSRGGLAVYCDPKRFKPLSDRLFRNQGDGTYKDVSESSGIGSYSNYTMGIVSADFNGDGWADIFVGNDVAENYLFLNQRNGTFKEIGTMAGVAYDLYGTEQGVMGVNVGDYDLDGRADILVTTFQNQVNTLYRNLGVLHDQLQFQDVTIQAGIGAGSLPLVTWGCGFGDFDNDQRLEIFIAAGHLQDNIERLDTSTSYKEQNQLFEWRGGKYINVAREVGGVMLARESSRGSVIGDLDNDGRLDLVVLNARSRPTIMRNVTASSHHWITLKLKGVRSNRSAVGAVARVTSENQTLVQEVRAGRSYQSAEDLRLHFGLGANRVEKLEITWPAGERQTWTNVKPDRILYITEGDSALRER